jgi:hypothetical protein
MIHLFLKNIPPVPLCGMNRTGRPKYDPSGSDPRRHGARRRAIHAFDFKNKGVDTGLRRYDEESPQPGHIEKDILQTRYGHEFSHGLAGAPSIPLILQERRGYRPSPVWRNGCRGKVGGNADW